MLARICGFESNGNLFLGNEFGANSFAAINLHLCSFNNLTQNLMNSNSVGTRLLDGANNNSIYHNNFVNNTVQAYIQSSYNNTWGDGYPSGGNYWSNYDDLDQFSGPYQNMTGSDGIGDAPLVIDGNNMDRYPLIGPWTEASNLVGDVNADGKVDMKDVGYVARRFMCVPGDELWDVKTDFNGDEKINMIDIGTVARHFGESLS